MSGLWLLFVLVVWGGLSWRLWKTLQRYAGAAGFASRPVRIGIVAVLVALWLGVSFWYAGGRKVYYDAEVNRLCAIDGGVKVYETVRLPAERFDKYGNVGIPNRQYAKSDAPYYFETSQEVLRSGDPTLLKVTTQIIRRADGKVLGRSIRYGRGGGDMPGPWHPSTFDGEIGDGEIGDRPRFL